MNSLQNRNSAWLLTAAIIAMSVLGISLSHAQMQDKGPHIDRGMRVSHSWGITSFEEQQKMEQFYWDRVAPHQEAVRRQYEEAERELRSKSEELDRRLAELEEGKLKSSGLAPKKAERELRSKSEELDRRLAELELMLRSEKLARMQTGPEAEVSEERRRLSEERRRHKEEEKEKEQKSALEYRLEAEQGYAQAQFSLGVCYGNGEGVPQDYAEAVKWYRLAAEQGHAQSQCNLGIAYGEGEGVPQDYAEAVKWWRKAAEQGHAQSQCNLGLCYDNGGGVPQDYAVAVKWLRLAAEQGNAGAQYRLGVCYYAGEGVPRDDVLSYMWLNLAAASGDEDAKTSREAISKKMTPEQIAEAQKLSREWKPKGQ